MPTSPRMFWLFIAEKFQSGKHAQILEVEG